MQPGHPEAGLPVLPEALAWVDRNGEHFHEAELYRLKGDGLLTHAPAPLHEAETCLQRALAVARRQQVKPLELGTALSLSLLWQRQGKHAAAQALLAPIYGWFTEGFDTADLQAAQALLHTPEAAACPNCAAPC